jgi:hypothetical protein
MKPQTRCAFCDHFHFCGIGEKCRQFEKPNPHFDPNSQEWTALEYAIGVILIIITFVLAWRYVD